jgi:hypothetical protein
VRDRIFCRCMTSGCKAREMVTARSETSWRTYIPLQFRHYHSRMDDKKFERAGSKAYLHHRLD